MPLLDGVASTRERVIVDPIFSLINCILRYAAWRLCFPGAQPQLLTRHILSRSTTAPPLLDFPASGHSLRPNDCHDPMLAN